MPTITFEKLSDDKKNRILDAAKKEFTRVPLNEVSIKNIVNDASIARGSFYQYFESKEDLLSYIIEKDWNMIGFIEKELSKDKIDIFDFYIKIFDHLAKKARNNKNKDFCRKIFENMKVSDTKYEIFEHADKKLLKKVVGEKLINKIDTSNLSINNEDELNSLIRILFLVTRGAFAFGIKHSKKYDVREDLIRNINIIKYGVCKKRRKDKNDKNIKKIK